MHEKKKKMKRGLTNACLRCDPCQTEVHDDPPNIQHATNLRPK